MKANNKSRRQARNDEIGVSSVVGTMLMVGIICAMAPIVMIAVGNLTIQFKTSIDTCTEAMRVCTDNMKNITDYMNRFNFRPGDNGGNNSTVPPYVEYEFNDTTQEWDFYYCQGHQSPWVKLHLDTELSQSRYILIVVVVGKGTVTKNPQFTSYSPGASVQINATASAGWCFMKWTGNINGTTNPTTITMNHNMTVYATFNNMLG